VTGLRVPLRDLARLRVSWQARRPTTRPPDLVIELPRPLVTVASVTVTATPDDPGKEPTR
jgi:hypothetical protein